MATDARFLQLQVTVPSKGHEDVGQDEEEDSGKTFHKSVIEE